MDNGVPSASKVTIWVSIPSPFLHMDKRQRIKAKLGFTIHLFRKEPMFCASLPVDATVSSKYGGWQFVEIFRFCWLKLAQIQCGRRRSCVRRCPSEAHWLDSCPCLDSIPWFDFSVNFGLFLLIVWSGFKAGALASGAHDGLVCVWQSLDIGKPFQLSSLPHFENEVSFTHE